ncbi:MAG: hypothetical protein Alpg2KO_25590 [Alphaproteobacteria bacterium]
MPLVQMPILDGDLPGNHIIFAPSDGQNAARLELARDMSTGTAETIALTDVIRLSEIYRHKSESTLMPVLGMAVGAAILGGVTGNALIAGFGAVAGVMMGRAVGFLMGHEDTVILRMTMRDNRTAICRCTDKTLRLLKLERGKS